MSKKQITVEVWQTRGGLIDHIAKDSPDSKEYAERDGYKLLNKYQIEVTEPEQKRPRQYWLEPAAGVLAADFGEFRNLKVCTMERPEYIHVIEKLPGSAMVTVESLTRALNEAEYECDTVGQFKTLLKAIGLEDA